MKKLNLVSDNELLDGVVKLRGYECKTVAEVILHLHQIDKRKLYREAGYSSLFAYCTEKLKYSAGSAYRRIEAARALEVSPEIYDLLYQGKISLCAVSEVAKVIDSDNKGEVINKSLGKSKLEVQAIASAYKKAEEPKKERIRVKRVKLSAAPEPLFASNDVTSPQLPQPEEKESYSISIELSKEEMALLNEAQLTLGVKGVKNYLLKSAEKIVRREKARKISGEKKSTSTAKVILAGGSQAPKPKSSSRYIPKSIQREVRLRDEDRCTYHSPAGHRCTERHCLQIDHIKPFSLGGSNEANNLRLLCRAHNTLCAERVFGREKIRSYQERSRHFPAG